jgi:hypothetical protein
MPRLSRRLARVFPIAALCVAAIVVITACSDHGNSALVASKHEMESSKMQLARVAAVPAVADQLAAVGFATATGAKESLAVLTAVQPDRYLIKNASMTIEVTDANAAADQLAAACQLLGGYISNLSQQSGAVGNRSVSITLRIPADKFDQAMPQLEAVGKSLNKEVSTEDVTEQYVDTESKSRNLKKMEERLLDHLGRAGELDDVLRVETELNRVREQIELMEGKLRFLGNRVSFSTIVVLVREAAKGETLVPPETFSTASVFSAASRSLIGFLQAFWAKAIWVAVWSPVWGVPLLVVFILWRSALRRQLRQRLHV